MDLKRIRARGALITFHNSRGLPLDGILYTAGNSPVTVLHVHGSMGNFYHNLFLRLMALCYVEAGINFLPFNLSAHDCITEGFRFDYSFEYTGGAIVDFGTCVDDIRAAIDEARKFSDLVILQGHSLGCDRIVHYLIEEGSDCSIILLGASDSYELQSRWIAPETVEEQIARLRAETRDSDELDWLSRKEYGVRSGAEEYPIPVTRRTFLTIAEGPPFQLFRFDRSPQFHLMQRALVYVGGKDAFLTSDPESVFAFFEEAFPEVTRVYVPDADHDMDEHEEEVIAKIIAWVKQQTGRL